MAEINGKPVDLSGIVPLKVGDWRAMQGHGITLDKLGSGDVEQLARFATYVAGKANTEIKKADIDALTLPALSAFVGECLVGSGVDAVPPADPS